MTKKSLFAVIAVAVCAILAAGGLLASNMGFKLNYGLTGPVANGGVGTGKNTLALPHFRQTGMNDATALLQDIQGTTTLTTVQSVSRYNVSTDLFQAYTARMVTTIPNFALQAGEGYLIGIGGEAGRNYIVVGSHDPTFAQNFQGPGTGSPVSATGKTFFAPPYNITAANAQQLLNDIQGTTTLTSVQSVSRYNKTTDLFQAYTARMVTTIPNFALVPGEGYLIGVSATIPGYIASHY
jgi:hypothetical protein